MKNVAIFSLLLSLLIFTSCATIFPVHNPDMTRDEYAGLIAAGSERTVCYEKGFRGGMLFLDVIFGWQFFFAPVIIDAATGKYTAYYYHHTRCENVKAQERKARLNDHPEPTTVTVIQQVPASQSEPTVQPVQSSSWDAPLSQQKQAKAPKPVPAVEPATVPEPAPAPTSQPQVEEDPEYDILF